MADIQEKIIEKYDINIAQENVLKLFKIEKADISSQEIQELIEATKKRWNQSINGANEKNAERDKARMNKIDKYEAILKDPKLFKELYAYYNKGSSRTQNSSGSAGGSVEFAREFFSLVETTKKLRKDDVDFFFNNYQSERKNKKAILTMLEKDFRVYGLDKRESSKNEEEIVEKEGKKKNDSSPLIVNLFQEATILKLRKCVDFYENAIQCNNVCLKYPKLTEGIYEFLRLKDIESIQQFTDMLSIRTKEVYAVRQEKGTDYVPLVDLFNTMQTLSEYRDVVDNFLEFKLLIKYPRLTPYMYKFVEMKPATLKGIVTIANREYAFRDETDFILNYFNPVYDNFGISNSGINALIKKAEKKAKQNKVLNEIDNKLGRKKKHKISIIAELVHWLVYWPIFAVYFVFEIFKVIFTKLNLLTIPLFIGTFIGVNWLFPKIFNIRNLLVLGDIFSKEKWFAFLDDCIGAFMTNGFEIFLLSIMAIIIMLSIYLLPALFVSLFVYYFCDDLNKRFDWIGLERTFKNIFHNIRKESETQYFEHKKWFYKRKVSKIIINVICLITFVVLLYLAPKGFRLFSEKTGYFQNDEISEKYYQNSEKSNTHYTE